MTFVERDSAIWNHVILSGAFIAADAGLYAIERRGNTLTFSHARS